MKIFVSAGEVSGDAILGAVLEKLQARYPHLELAGLGGERAEAFGLKSLFELKATAINGAWDIFLRMFFLLKMLRTMKSAMKKFAPNLVILVDYPGLNLRLAQKAREQGFKVLFIAPPQNWAYRNVEKRMRRTARALQGCALHVLFPFEVEPYQKMAASVSVGHFYVTVTDRLPMPKAYPKSSPVFVLFPGSRLSVIRRNLPVWLKRLEDGGFLDTMQFNVLVPEAMRDEVTWILPSTVARKVEILTDKKRAMAAADYAIVFPGTMTMELALAGVRTMVLAVVDPVTFWVGRRVLADLSWLALPNLLLKKNLFPEWAGTVTNITDEKFADLMRHLISRQGGLEGDMALTQKSLHRVIGDGCGAEEAAQHAIRELVS